MKKVRAHISGIITNLPKGQKKKFLDFYDQLALVCRRHGWQTFVPHHFIDPEEFPASSPAEVYDREMRDLKEADVVIAYVGQPSLGVGMEVEAARAQNAIIILMSEKGTNVSRLIRGCPAVIHEIEFADFPDALKKLNEALAKIEI
jgi:2'-deoxynucleoside 5'-phosphate N-hydrolase